MQTQTCDSPLINFVPLKEQGKKFYLHSLSSQRKITFHVAGLYPEFTPIAGRSMAERSLDLLVEHGYGNGIIHPLLKKRGWLEHLEFGHPWGIDLKVEEKTQDLRFYLCLDDVIGYFNPNRDIKDHHPIQKKPSQSFFTHDGFHQTVLYTMAHNETLFDMLPSKKLDAAVFAAPGATIHPTAKCVGPCYIGENVTIGADSVIGPMTCLENNVVIGANTHINKSWIGPNSRVGSHLTLHDLLLNGAHAYSVSHQCTIPLQPSIAESIDNHYHYHKECMT